MTKKSFYKGFYKSWMVNLAYLNQSFYLGKKADCLKYYFLLCKLRDFEFQRVFAFLYIQSVNLVPASHFQIEDFK